MQRLRLFARTGRSNPAAAALTAALILAAATLLMGAALASAASGVSIVERNDLYHFQPNTISVTVGSTVTWTDDSDTTHTISSDTLSGPLNGQVQSGQKYSATFNTAGTYPYHCNIHTYMHGVVHVAAAPSVPPTDTTAPRGGSNVGWLFALSAIGSLLLIARLRMRLSRREVEA